MNLPPYGVCLPCEYRRCRHGDTVEVSLAGGNQLWMVHLIGCNTPAADEPGGAEAKAFAETMLEQADQVSVFVPLPEQDEPVLRSLLSLDRASLLGVVYLDSQTTVSERLIRAGYALA